MEIIKKNLLKAKENIIVHQVNCMGVMGSGLAKSIKKKYPEVFNGYYHFCKTNLVEEYFGTALICEANDDKYIANVFGQINYGTEERQTDYDRLKQALIEVKNFAKEKGLSVAIPYKLGCGLAGGDWNIVFDMITEVFNDVECNIYRYERKKNG